MGTTYGYHYGGKINRGERYEKVASKVPTSKANLGEGHSAKSNNTDFADLREWYAKLDHDTKSAMDKAADKPTSRFTNEERDNFYLKVDPYHYLQYLQFRYPNKTEFIQSRMHSYYGFRRHLEENGIAPKKSAETKPETQYAEQAVKEQAKSEKSAEEKALDDVWADSLGIPRSELNSAKPNTASQPAANPEKVTPEKQVAQGMVDNSKPNLLDLSFNEKIYRPWAEEYGERARPNDMDWIPDPTEFWATRDNYPNPQPLVKYNPFLAALRSNGKLTSLGYAGLTGLALLAPYLKQNSTNEQSQTQPPYLMEPESEPVNEAVAQSELTPEQQFVLQSTSPFDYAKGINLFDLYDRYGSPDSIDNSIPEEQSVDENTPQPDSDTYRNAQEMGQRIASGTGYAPELKEDNFEFPQNPPEVGSNIKTAGLKSPNGGDVPQELNRLSGVKPKIIKDTSKGPVVLNDPNHRKTRNVQNNPVTPEQAAASQMVNQYAGIPAEVVRAKNQPFLTTDAIWNRLRQKGLVSPEEGIRSGLFTPDEVRYITENDLWRYR